MSIETRYLFVVAMDVAPEKEALFHEVYDSEHIPYLQEVPGVHAVTRGVSEPFGLAIGGSVAPKDAASPRFVAIYEIDSPDVLASDAWAEAVERGRWGTEVRPFTTNRAHALYRVR
jgi:hypothetical protein